MFDDRNLRNMRMLGAVPFMVHIDTDAGTRGHDRLWPFDPDQPSTPIGPQENLTRVDLRSLVGLFVKVAGCDEARVMAVAKACRRAKAARVVAVVHEQRGEGRDATYPIIKVADTEGVLTWQST